MLKGLSNSLIQLPRTPACQTWKSLDPEDAIGLVEGDV